MIVSVLVALQLKGSLIATLNFKRKPQAGQSKTH